MSNSEFSLLRNKLIDENPDLAIEVFAYCAKLGRPIGWHYILDIVWILDKLDVPPNAKILDAGAGFGITQFMLASMGYEVYSVDKSIRHQPLFTKNLYNIDFLTEQDQPDEKYERFSHLPDLPLVTFHSSDLSDLKCFEDSTFDAVVSISAIEHNPPDKVKSIMQELTRILKEGGQQLLTISVADKEQYHQESNSYLLNREGVQDTYKLDSDTCRDFDSYEDIFSEFFNDERLKRWMPYIYFQGGNNGMPWGKWDPKYLPAGINLRKRVDSTK